MIYFELGILLLLNTIMEFLPISSTAHFLILSRFFSISSNTDLIMSVAQLSMVFYLVFYFKNYVIDILKNIYKKDYIIYCSKILITMLPTMLFGLFCYKIIKNYFYGSLWTSVFLILGSILMLLAEKKHKNKENNLSYDEGNNLLYNVTYKESFIIGFIQMFSLLTGFSRSGSTISAGLLLNYSRKKAILFSFFISMPISFCASIFNIIQYDIKSNLNIILFTFFITLFFSCIIIKKILLYLEKHTLNVFIYYRIVLALLILIFGFYGIF